MNGFNNFDIGLLDRYLDIYDAVEKALIDHMSKPSMKRMTGQAGELRGHGANLRGRQGFCMRRSM